MSIFYNKSLPGETGTTDVDLTDEARYRQASRHTVTLTGATGTYTVTYRPHGASAYTSAIADAVDVDVAQQVDIVGGDISGIRIAATGGYDLEIIGQD